MGGKNSFLKKPVGTGDFSKSFVGEGLNSIGGVYKTVYGGGAKAIADVDKAILKGGAQAIREGLGEITGSNAARKAAMDQQQSNEEATKRQADASDAMARAAGGDPTAIFLATGKKKKGAGGAGTGSAGTGSSRNTGVQS